jgi:protein-S-isoprenylcysteine O-methyltransferase Ste14
MKNTGANAIPSVRGQEISLMLNLAAMTVFYLFLGAAVSYAFANVVPKYDDEWKKQPQWYRIADVTAELVVIVILAFWISYLTRFLIPIVPLSSKLETYVESFGVQLAFLYAIFIFLETLDDKMIDAFQDIFH